MKKSFIFALLFLTIPLFVSAQDKYARIAFVYSISENKSMFVNDGFSVKSKELENGGLEQYFMKPNETNEYKLVYNNLGHLESLTLYASEELYRAFKLECSMNYKEETPKDDEVLAVYTAPGYRYSFSMYTGFLEIGYMIEIESAPIK